MWGRSPMASKQYLLINSSTHYHLNVLYMIAFIAQRAPKIGQHPTLYKEYKKIWKTDEFPCWHLEGPNHTVLHIIL